MKLSDVNFKNLVVLDKAGVEERDAVDAKAREEKKKLREQRQAKKTDEQAPAVEDNLSTCPVFQIILRMKNEKIDFYKEGPVGARCTTDCVILIEHRAFLIRLSTNNFYHIVCQDAEVETIRQHIQERKSINFPIVVFDLGHSDCPFFVTDRLRFIPDHGFSFSQNIHRYETFEDANRYRKKLQKSAEKFERPQPCSVGTEMAYATSYAGSPSFDKLRETASVNGWHATTAYTVTLGSGFYMFAKTKSEANVFSGYWKKHKQVPPGKALVKINGPDYCFFENGLFFNETDFAGFSIDTIEQSHQARIFSSFREMATYQWGIVDADSMCITEDSGERFAMQFPEDDFKKWVNSAINQKCAPGTLQRDGRFFLWAVTLNDQEVLLFHEVERARAMSMLISGQFEIEIKDYKLLVAKREENGVWFTVVTDAFNTTQKIAFTHGNYTFQNINDAASNALEFDEFRVDEPRGIILMKNTNDLCDHEFKAGEVLIKNSCGQYAPSNATVGSDGIGKLNQTSTRNYRNIL